MVVAATASPALASDGSWTTAQNLNQGSGDVEEDLAISGNGRTAAFMTSEGAFASRFNASTELWETAQVNSEEVEVITLSEDGKTIAWMGDPDSDYEVFAITFDGTSWSSPVSISGDIPIDYEAGPIRLSADGRTALFISDDDELWTSRFNGSEWSRAKVADNVYAGENYLLSADGAKVVYGHDDSDPKQYWRSIWDGASWSAGSLVTPLTLDVTESEIVGSADLDRIVFPVEGDNFWDELWVTSYVDGAWQDPLKLCQNLCQAPGAYVNKPQISANGSTVVYDLHVDGTPMGEFQLYFNDITASGVSAPQLISDASEDGTDVPTISADGQRVAYNGDLNNPTSGHQKTVLCDSYSRNRHLGARDHEHRRHQPRPRRNPEALGQWARNRVVCQRIGKYCSLGAGIRAGTAGRARSTDSGKVGTNAAKVSFAKPAQTGGPAVPIEEYEVQTYVGETAVADKTCTAVDPAADAMFCNVEGLPAAKYRFKVRAKNATGWSEYSAASNEVTISNQAKSILSLPDQVVANAPTPVTIKVTVDNEPATGEALVYQVRGTSSAASASANKFVCKAQIVAGSGKCIGRFGLGKIQLVSLFNGATISDLESNKDSASMAAVSIIPKRSGKYVRLSGQVSKKKSPVWIYRTHKRSVPAKLVATTRANNLHAWAKAKVRTAGVPVFFCAVTPQGPSATIKVTKKGYQVVSARKSARGDFRFC